MKIGIITPAPPRSRYGNRVTALRWARILKELGHRVTIAQVYAGEGFDMLVALHARRSHDAVRRWRSESDGAPLIVALTGTDLYQDLATSREAQATLDLADRLILLQPKGIEELRPELQPKARVIYQSVVIPSPSSGNGNARTAFDVCVIGHLRDVKDPFRAALAARLLPASSRIRVLQIGGELEEGMASQAHAEMEANPRYRWLGERPRWAVFRILRRSRLLVLSSHLEGGANVLSEAIVAGVPVLASRISGSIGILGEDYPGYFDVGDTEALAELMSQAETDEEFLADLDAHCATLAPLFEPAHEKRRWADLLSELLPVHRPRGDDDQL